MTATRPAWLLDEQASAGDENLDANHVAIYDVKAGIEPLDDVDRLLGLGITIDSTLVDLGAGTGRLAIAMAPHCGRVVAVDVSPVMLSRLRHQVEVSGHRNIKVVEGGFLTYEHTGAPADLVYSRNALHHVPDFWKAVALQRIAAMLRPGGVFRLRDLVYNFEPAEARDRIDVWMSTAPNDPTNGWTREDLEVHVREEHSTFAWLLEPMLERVGFDIVEADYRDNGIFARYVCVKRA
jgi:SAM-dependent methyltransferase